MPTEAVTQSILTKVEVQPIKVTPKPSVPTTPPAVKKAEVESTVQFSAVEDTQSKPSESSERPPALFEKEQTTIKPLATQTEQAEGQREQAVTSPSKTTAEDASLPPDTVLPSQSYEIKSIQPSAEKDQEQEPSAFTDTDHAETPEISTYSSKDLSSHPSHETMEAKSAESFPTVIIPHDVSQITDFAATTSAPEMPDSSAIDSVPGTSFEEAAVTTGESLTPKDPEASSVQTKLEVFTVFKPDTSTPSTLEEATATIKTSASVQTVAKVTEKEATLPEQPYATIREPVEEEQLPPEGEASTDAVVTVTEQRQTIGLPKEESFVTVKSETSPSLEPTSDLVPSQPESDDSADETTRSPFQLHYVTEEVSTSTVYTSDKTEGSGMLEEDTLPKGTELDKQEEQFPSATQASFEKTPDDGTALPEGIATVLTETASAQERQTAEIPAVEAEPVGTTKASEAFTGILSSQPKDSLFEGSGVEEDTKTKQTETSEDQQTTVSTQSSVTATPSEKLDEDRTESSISQDGLKYVAGTELPTADVTGEQVLQTTAAPKVQEDVAAVTIKEETRASPKPISPAVVDTETETAVTEVQPDTTGTSEVEEKSVEGPPSPQSALSSLEVPAAVTDQLKDVTEGSGEDVTVPLSVMTDMAATTPLKEIVLTPRTLPPLTSTQKPLLIDRDPDEETSKGTIVIGESVAPLKTTTESDLTSKKPVTEIDSEYITSGKQTKEPPCDDTTGTSPTGSTEDESQHLPPINVIIVSIPENETGMPSYSVILI